MIGFGFTSHWLKNWREAFKPITKHSNFNHVITFDSHLKTALNQTESNQIKSNQMLGFGKRGKPEYLGEKSPRAEWRTIKFNSHMTLTLEIKPGPHW